MGDFGDMPVEDAFAGEGPRCNIEFPRPNSWKLLRLRWSLKRAKRKAGAAQVTETIMLRRFLGNVEETGISGQPITATDHVHVGSLLREYLAGYNLDLKNLELKSNGSYSENGNCFAIIEASVTV